MQCPPTRPGPERQEVPLAAGRLEHLLRVDAEPVEDHRELVDERDVDVALRVLDHLGGFGDADRGRRVRAGRDDRPVQLVDERGGLGRRAGSDLADRRQPVLAVARVDALRAVAGKEVAVELEPGPRSRIGTQISSVQPGIHGRLVNHDVAALQHPADGLARALERASGPAACRRRSASAPSRCRRGRSAGPSASDVKRRRFAAAAPAASTSSVRSLPRRSSAMRSGLMSKPIVS